MVPTVLLLGFVTALVLGRWAWGFIPLAAVAWGVGLHEATTCVGGCVSGAALMGGINAAVGVAFGLVVRWPVTAFGK